MDKPTHWHNWSFFGEGDGGGGGSPPAAGDGVGETPHLTCPECAHIPNYHQ